ncbi:LTR retrotransposon, partial [Pseudoloma neurophilia]
EKMAIPVNRASDELLDWFYDVGSKGNLPGTWEEFKELFTQECVGTSFGTLKRFDDEKWTEYFRRVSEISEHRKIDKSKMIEKLREDQMPNEIRVLLYCKDLDFSEVIRIVEDWEKTRKTIREKRFTQVKKDAVKGQHQLRDMSKIRCHLCGNVGHMKRDCKVVVKKPVNAALSRAKTDSNEEEVKLNGFKYIALPDTGSSFNIITRAVLNKLKNVKIQKLQQPVKILLLNCQSIKAVEKCLLKLEFRHIVTNTDFYIINNGIFDVIIGNEICQAYSKYEQCGFPIECTIPTEDNKVVSVKRPLRSFVEKQKLQAEISRYEALGYLEKSESIWLNPVVLTTKKNGETRFCLDLRWLNKLVSLDEYCVPKIEELIVMLRDQKFFSTIDLKDGFFQVPLSKNDRHKTAFTDGDGRLYQFTRMPQGYKNSSATFQRGMNIILNEYVNKICIVYLDDLLIFGKNEDECKQNEALIRERIKSYKMIINEKKSQSCLESVDFLGYRISHNTISPLVSRAQGIEDFSVPKNKTNVREFIGLLNFDRIFLPKIAEVLKPLYRLMGDKTLFEWGNDEQKAFEAAKMAYAEHVKLSIPDMNDDFELETDVSEYGIGVVLKQQNRPVAFASRVLTTTESNYGVTEREFLGLVWGVKKFEYFLKGRKFKCYTDHKPLTEITRKKSFKTPKFNRWMTKLQEFDMDVIYKPGSEMAISDALSRSRGDGNQSKEEIVMRINNKQNHRKVILNLVREDLPQIRKKELKNILRNCLVCAAYDSKDWKGGAHILTEAPGERIGVDFMKVGNRWILIAID